MKVDYGDYVTVVDNETNKEISGHIMKYTSEEIVLHIYKRFNAKNVHFKENNKQPYKNTDLDRKEE